MIRCLKEKKITDSDLYLAQIAAAIRATTNCSTGHTPNKLMLGREVFKPVDIVFGLASANMQRKTPDGYIRNLENIIKISHDTARECLRESVLVNGLASLDAVGYLRPYKDVHERLYMFYRGCTYSTVLSITSKRSHIFTICVW